jgi:hypothetical protein
MSQLNRVESKAKHTYTRVDGRTLGAAIDEADDGVLEWLAVLVLHKAQLRRGRRVRGSGETHTRTQTHRYTDRQRVREERERERERPACC